MRGRIPSVREILREFNIHSVKLYSTFPGGLREICMETKVPFLAYRTRLAEAMKEKRRSKEREVFKYRRSSMRLRVRELGYAFKLRTQDVKDESY